MKRLVPITGSVALAALLASSAGAQTAPTTNDQQQLARAVAQLQEQQAAIAQNQAKIEEKLALVAEAVRQARLFASRAGSGKR